MCIINKGFSAFFNVCNPLQLWCILKELPRNPLLNDTLNVNLHNPPYISQDSP